MAKIKNMGTATMKFKEGIIVDGNAGETTDSLIVSGTTVFKDHAQMEVNKRFYFDGSSIANGPYIYGNTVALFIDGDDRLTLSMDKDFRILDEDNNAIIHITDKDATGNDAYKEFNDVNIFFSGSVGSIDGNIFGASAFGGDLVVSGTIEGKNSALGMGTHDLHIGSKDNFLAFGSSFQFNQNNNNIGNPGDDVFLFMSGTVGGKGTGGVSVLGGDAVVSGSLIIESTVSFEDYIMADLSIPGLDLQNDTNAFRFNCPYNLIVEGLDLYLDQHTTSGNVTVTVSNGANNMITLSIPDVDLTASTTTVSNATRSSGDVITFAITATPANAQGLRANMRFRRLV
jgi:hypothetical protein